MSLKPLVTKELLFAYFAGQATVLQKQMIENWVEKEPDNEEFFYACLHEWEMKYPQYNTDTDTAIDKFNNRILDQSQYFIQPDTEQQSRKINMSGALQKWLVAASIIFVVLFGAWVVQDSIAYKSYSTGNGELSKIVLSDGSRVVLNENSVLQVPRFGFGEFSRKVYLSGEARFSVVHTPDHKKFVVLTDSVFQVEVLGTEFNLAARKGATKVVLQEGKVKVLYQQSPEQAATALIMAPGDLVTVDQELKKLHSKKVRHPQNYSAWQHGQYVFDKTSMLEIKEMMLDNYGLEVRLRGDNISTKTVSGSFKASNADELLQALADILDLKFLRTGDQVVLADNS